MSTQNERAQQAIDMLPDCFSAELIAKHTKILADTFTRRYGYTEATQRAIDDSVELKDALNDLIVLGEALQANQGFYCKDSTEREDILRAYINAFRIHDTIVEREGSFWNPEKWKQATKEVFEEIGELPGNIVKTILLPTLEGLWPVIAIVGVVLIVVVVIQAKVKA